VPFKSTAQVVPLPTEMALTPVRPVTDTGVLEHG
jgi:hypothetical protein